MLWLPVLSLPLMVVLVLTVVALLFWDVAFKNQASVLPAGSSNWGQATFTNTARLRAWGADVARRAVASRTRSHRTARTAAQIADDLERDADNALRVTGSQFKSHIPTKCPTKHSHQIGVTVPEVLAIADELDGRFPKSEVHLIHELAVLNASRARTIVPHEFPAAGISCPLRSESGECLTFTRRPIACRRLCPNSNCCSSTTSSGADSSPAELTESLRDGMTDGLSEGLKEAGLDGTVYELNDALATALATPNAAERWARGEPVFAGCLPA